jgi:Cobalamin adenosyltransferase
MFMDSVTGSLIIAGRLRALARSPAQPAILAFMEPKFDQPRMAINRVYTRRGDAGETSLAGGQRVAKDSRRIEAYGTVDELNAFHRGGRTGHGRAM